MGCLRLQPSEGPREVALPLDEAKRQDRVDELGKKIAGGVEIPDGGLECEPGLLEAFLGQARIQDRIPHGIVVQVPTLPHALAGSPREVKSDGRGVAKAPPERIQVGAGIVIAAVFEELRQALGGGIEIVGHSDILALTKGAR
jgi:hypothetical protein